MGTHGAAGASGAARRRTRARVALIAAASITWLFTAICLIGVCADGDPEARLGFVVLGVPFLVAALATTYGARTAGAGGQAGAGEITRAAQGEVATVSLTKPDGLDLANLPAGTRSSIEAMRRSYAELDAKLTDDERDTEAWRTMTQIVHSIVPTTVGTYRRVAGYGDADAEFSHAVSLLSRTFEERRTAVTTAMLEGLRIEARYIEDRFTPSELTVDGLADSQQPKRAGQPSRCGDAAG